MKIIELRKLSVADLDKQLVEKHAELTSSRRSLAAGELANPLVVRSQRREIAVLKTVLAELRKEEKINDNKTKEKDNV